MPARCPSAGCRWPATISAAMSNPLHAPMLPSAGLAQEAVAGDAAMPLNAGMPPVGRLPSAVGPPELTQLDLGDARWRYQPDCTR